MQKTWYRRERDKIQEPSGGCCISSCENVQGSVSSVGSEAGGGGRGEGASLEEERGLECLGLVVRI